MSVHAWLAARVSILRVLRVTSGRWWGAAQLGFAQLCRQGLLAASTPLLIIVPALAHHATLRHCDRDFEPLVRHVPLVPSASHIRFALAS